MFNNMSMSYCRLKWRFAYHIIVPWTPNDSQLCLNCMTSLAVAHWQAVSVCLLKIPFCIFAECVPGIWQLILSQAHDASLINHNSQRPGVCKMNGIPGTHSSATRLLSGRHCSCGRYESVYLICLWVFSVVECVYYAWTFFPNLFVDVNVQEDMGIVLFLMM